MIGAVAEEARGLTWHFDREVSMLSLIRAGRAMPLLALALGERYRVRADPRLVFRLGFSGAADGLVLAHNHIDELPPSPADLVVTRRLVAAGAVVGLPLVAHIVVTDSGWYDCVAGSFAHW